MNEEKTELDRCILTIFEGVNKDDKQIYWWDYPDKEKIFKIIGIMEAVKLDLLNEADKLSE